MDFKKFAKVIDIKCDFYKIPDELIIKKIQKSFPISLSDNLHLIDDIYEKNKSLSKADIAKILIDFLTCIRILHILGAKHNHILFGFEPLDLLLRFIRLKKRKNKKKV